MKSKDKFVVLTVVSAIVATYTVLYLLQMPADVGITIVVATSLLVVLMVELYRRQAELLLTVKAKQATLETRIDHSVREVQSLIFLNDYLKPNRPLPLMGGWAASSDFLGELVSTLAALKPNLVVDLGSGVTTLVAAYCMEKNNKGLVISLDHDQHFAEKTRIEIEAHGLSHRARVNYAPLVETKLGEKIWLWYDSTALNFDGLVDVLIVDGPPGPTQHLVRYPALPLLYSRLSTGSVVFLDDGARPDEKIIAERWKAEFPDLKSDYKFLQKGLFVFRRH